jgi:hypothetical protein
MDFLDPKKARAHRRRIMIGYGLIAIILAICTTALVLVTNGYGFDRKTGAIIQNGLVFVSSHPVGSNIYINGQGHGGTDGRFVLEEGTYTFELKQNGYRTWQRTINLEGSSIERLVYPFLFPEKLVSHDLQAYATAPDMVTESPDRHWIITHVPDSLNSFAVTDTSTKDNATTTITLPTTMLAPHPNQKIEAVEWSTDNQHVLIKDTYDGGADYIILDRITPTDSANLTQVFGHGFSKVSLRDKNVNQLYVYEAGSGLLEYADPKTKALTVVASHILSYWPYGANTLVYVSDEATPAGKVYVKMLDGDKTYTLRTLPTSPTYLLNMATFSGHQYVAVGTSAESRVYLYEDPLDTLKKRPTQEALAKALLRVDTTAEFVSFSTNTRFVAVQGGSTFAVYDAENNRQFRYDTKLPLTGPQQAQWMDGHRLSLASGSKLNIFDFDGTNNQALVTSYPAYAPMFDRDYTALFTVSPSTTSAAATAAKPALIRTELIVR